MKNYCLYFAWVIACIATLSSMYFSEVKGLEPCHLCWYQRICLFPLAILLGIATYKSDFSIVPYAIALILFGLGFAIYQIILQETGMSLVEMCGAGPSCTEKINIGFGSITMPMLSAIAQLMILSLLLFCESPWKTAKNN